MIVYLLQASFLVWALAVIMMGVMKRISIQSSVSTFITTSTVFITSVILTQGTGILGFVIIFTSPVWVAMILAMLIKVTVGNLELALAKMGYLGTQKKWMYQLYMEDERDREYEAAKTLLSSKKIKEIKEVSTSKQDFRDNVVEAAGIDERREKPINDVLLSDQE